MSDQPIALEADLLDLDGLGLDDLRKLDGTALGNALRRVLWESEHSGPTMDSWKSSV